MNESLKDSLASASLWYAIYCRHKHERVVNDVLATKGILSYLAEYETRVQWGTRCRKVRKNMLPGYVLVNMPAHDSELYLHVLQTHGVVKFVGKPWPQLSAIPTEQIDSVKALLGSQNVFEETAYFSAGEPVKVFAGPLAGMVGRIMHATCRKSRVVISIDLLQRSVAVEVDSDYLQRLQPIPHVA
jgi:transcription antitermination factor NusG